MTIQPDADRQFITALCRHTVAFCIKYAHLRGPNVGEEFIFGCSAFVLATGDRWSLVTASHVLDEVDSIVTASGVVVTHQFLLDGFGPDAKDRNAVPFQLLSEPRVKLYDEAGGFDGALILISEHDQRLVGSNGVEPAPFRRNGDTDLTAYKDFGVVGFPAERVHLDKLQPNFLPLDLMGVDDDERASREFVGRLKDLGALTGIKGMSGSPIYGFYERDGKTYYELVAIQTSWNQSDRIYGCLMKRLLDTLWESGPS